MNYIPWNYLLLSWSSLLYISSGLWRPLWSNRWWLMYVYFLLWHQLSWQLCFQFSKDSSTKNSLLYCMLVVFFFFFLYSILSNVYPQMNCCFLGLLFLVPKTLQAAPHTLWHTGAKGGAIFIANRHYKYTTLIGKGVERAVIAQQIGKTMARKIYCW